jgi:subtilisin family serine protease
VRALVFFLVFFAAPIAYAERWPTRPLGEVARAQIGADAAFERYGTSGRGTVLCAIDTGIDASLADFAADGATRIVWTFDPFAPPRGVHRELEARFRGAVWSGEELDAPRDVHGHGTAIASIAAGARGVAPASAIIAVHAYDPEQRGFPDDAVIEGIDFCMAARDPSRPLVVLLSLGGHDGPHDGTSAFERAIAERARQVPIVVAAGNDGARSIRASGRLFNGERSAIEVRVPRSDREDAALAITFAREGEGAMVIVSPEGDRAPLAPGEIELDGARASIEAIDGTLRITLRARDGALAAGTYRIELEGPQIFDAWLAGDRLGPTFFAPGLEGPHARTDEAISVPATSEGVIAVGATIARMRAASLEQDGEPGSIAPFSSRGPRRDGAPLPDVAAPGAIVLAALSRAVIDGDPENLAGGALAPYLEDGRIAMQGSSISAAIVAGALLLALELDPACATDARELAIASTDHAAWRADRGYGEIDVLRMLEVCAGARSAEPDSISIAPTRPFSPVDRALFFAIRATGEGWPASERARISIGDRSAEAPLRRGNARLSIRPSFVELGALYAQASIDGRPLDPILVPVVLERGERGAVTTGGGCAVARSGSAPIGASLLLLLAILRSQPLGPRRSRTTRNVRT